MKNWGWVTIFQHIKKGGSGNTMHCIRGRSCFDYSHLIIVLAKRCLYPNNRTLFDSWNSVNG